MRPKTIVFMEKEALSKHMIIILLVTDGIHNDKNFLLKHNN